MNRPTDAAIDATTRRYAARLDRYLPRGSWRRATLTGGLAVVVTVGVWCLMLVDDAMVIVAGVIVYLSWAVAAQLGGFYARRDATRAVADRAVDLGIQGLAVEGEYVIVSTDTCTCAGPVGPQGEHEPYCGWEPLVTVADLRRLGFTLRRH